jgi:hypothetical protein
LRLSYIPSGKAKSDALATLGSVFMRAAPASLKPLHKPRRFLFRISHTIGERLVPAQRVDLALLMGQASANEADVFVDRLFDSVQNFELEHCGAVTLRGVDDLMCEMPLLPERTRLCLNYLSPLHFSPEDPLRPGAISPDQWIHITRRRLEAFLGHAVPVVELVPGLEFDSRRWSKVEIAAQSRSSSGTWCTVGNAGPLILSGAYETIWPLLLLAQEIPLGDAKIGGGAMQLQWH